MENNNSNGISIAALVCGIVGIIGSFFTVIPAIAIIALIIAIAGIILGAIGMKKANENNGSEKGLAIARTRMRHRRHGFLLRSRHLLGLCRLRGG